LGCKRALELQFDDSDANNGSMVTPGGCLAGDT